MNIIRYKNINELIEKKDIYLAQEIDNDQLRLISKGYIPTKFNVGINDVLEFVLYDNNNNILPQESFGNVRYIKGDSIKEYLLISTNPFDTVYEGGGFVVDIKKLIKEAGYNTGYFRVQINFVNNRVGSDYPTDKLWIQEISPSRLEMRLLPFNNFDETNKVEMDIKNDLNQSYDSFVLGKFSGDEIYQEIYQILESLNANDIANMMKTILTQQTIDKLAQEFNIIGGYSLFYERVLDTMKKAVTNELLYRNSIIGSSDFGKPISDTVRNKISQKDYNYYTKKEIVDLLNKKFKESLNFHLPKRKLNESIKIDVETQNSLDILNDVVQKLSSDSIFQIPIVEKESINTTTNNSERTVEGNYSNEISNTETPNTENLDISIPITFLLGPTFNNITSDSVNITWSTNIGAKGKIVFLSPCPSIGCELNLVRSAASHIYNVSALVPNTDYTFNVISYTSDGKSSTSDIVSFRTLPIQSDEMDILDPYSATRNTISTESYPIDYSGVSTSPANLRTGGRQIK